MEIPPLPEHRAHHGRRRAMAAATRNASEMHMVIRMQRARLRKAKKETEGLENWRLEVQARFIRALHELDYVGFIKHTGRKRDHVLRTVLDAPITE